MKIAQIFRISNVTKQPTRQQSSYKGFYYKLKDFFWSHSLRTGIARSAEVILIGGAVCYVPWLTSDALSPDYPWYRVYLILLGIFLLIAHIVASVKNDAPECTLGVAVFFCIIFAGIIAFVGTKRHRVEVSRKEETPRPYVDAPWQPPELQKGCSNVIISLGGGQETIYPLFFATISPDLESGTRISFKDAPDWFMAPMATNSQYSPRQRYMYFRYEGLITVMGVTFQMPASPYIVSNRLFVSVETPFGNGKRRIFMSDALALNLPRLWDRNYNSNRFEIVTETGNPVLQVIYQAANRVLVNGLFIVSTNSVYAVFDGRANLFTADYLPDPSPTQANVLAKVTLTNITDINNPSAALYEAFTNAVYDNAPIKGKAIFKYPSWKYPGVLAGHHGHKINAAK